MPCIILSPSEEQHILIKADIRVVEILNNYTYSICFAVKERLCLLTTNSEVNTLGSWITLFPQKLTF